MTYNKKSLTDEEKEIFDVQFPITITKHLKYREFTDIFEDNRDVILEAAEISKYQLEAVFGGVNCTTAQFGWTFPTAAMFKQTSSTHAYNTNTWNKYISTSDVTNVSSTYGWLDYIGTSSSAFKMSKYGCMVILGFVDPVEKPKVDALLATVKAVDYPRWDMSWEMESSDLNIYELVDPIILEKEQEMYIQEHVCAAGLDKLQPIAICFGKGDWLRSKNAYAQI